MQYINLYFKQYNNYYEWYNKKTKKFECYKRYNK